MVKFRSGPWKCSAAPEKHSHGRWRSRSLWLLTAGAIPLVLAACGSSPSSSAASSTKKPPSLTAITISNSNTLGWAPEFIAKQEGFFKKEGLNVTITFDTGDSETVPALSDGSAQFGVVTTPADLEAMAKGEPLVMVANIDSQITQQYAINATFASKVGITKSMSFTQKMNKLKAAGTYAVGTLDIGGGLQLVFDGLASADGMQLNKSFTMSAVSPYSSLVLALETGRIDVGLFGPPYAYDAAGSGKAIMLADAALGQIPAINNWMFGAMTTSKSYAKSHPKVVKEVQAAIQDALNLIHQQPKKAIASLEKTFPQLPASTIKSVVTVDGNAFAKKTSISSSTFDRARTLTAKYVETNVKSVAYSSSVYKP